MAVLVNKARNLVVKITLKSNGQVFLGRVMDFDDRFLEVQVRIDAKTGKFSTNAADFNNGSKVPSDRILVALDDISMIV